jgi:hypothetical protein
VSFLTCYYSTALVDSHPFPFSELHLLEYHHRTLDYVTNFQQVKAERGGMEYFSPSALRPFSPPDDATGYGNKSVSDKIITEVFLIRYQLIIAITLSFDNTYRAASKATLTDKHGKKVKPMKGGILSALNERNEIVSWVGHVLTLTHVCATISNCITALLPDAGKW